MCAQDNYLSGISAAANLADRVPLWHRLRTQSVIHGPAEMRSKSGLQHPIEHRVVLMSNHYPRQRRNTVRRSAHVSEPQLFSAVDDYAECACAFEDVGEVDSKLTPSFHGSFRGVEPRSFLTRALSRCSPRGGIRGGHWRSV